MFDSIGRASGRAVILHLPSHVVVDDRSAHRARPMPSDVPVAAGRPLNEAFRTSHVTGPGLPMHSAGTEQAEAFERSKRSSEPCSLSVRRFALPVRTAPLLGLSRVARAVVFAVSTPQLSSMASATTAAFAFTRRRQPSLMRSCGAYRHAAPRCSRVTSHASCVSN